METVAVRWNVELETWFVSLLTPVQDESQADGRNPNNWRPFDEWAGEQADLSQLRFILQGENYVCRWLTLPGVQGRNLSRALPFALEESLIEDISQYHLVTAGKQGKFSHRIYCSVTENFIRLLEACTLRHITLNELIPETSLIPDNSLVHEGHFWLINIPGLSEAKIHEFAIAAFFEGLCNGLEVGSQQSITLIDSNLDTANLLKTQLESNFTGIFKAVNVKHGRLSSLRDEALSYKCCNLLTEEFRPTEPKKDQPIFWWKPLTALAACWLIFSFTEISIENKRLIAQQEQVKAETIGLYQRLFPSERVRFLERQIRSKVKGDSTITSAGVMIMLSQASKALQQDNLKQMIQWQSFRFNDRQNQLIIDLTSKTLAQLQSYKSALEQQGLSVEIAQATNDDKGVKGRLKIGASA
ncbi:MAG: general secretion pathway protein L [Oleispira sp.]|jgi:general secretion pathway protein L